jgi:hypothetical protein
MVRIRSINDKEKANDQKPGIILSSSSSKMLLINQKYFYFD